MGVDRCGEGIKLEEIGDMRPAVDAHAEMLDVVFDWDALDFDVVVLGGAGASMVVTESAEPGIGDLQSDETLVFGFTEECGSELFLLGRRIRMKPEDIVE